MNAPAALSKDFGSDSRITPERELIGTSIDERYLVLGLLGSGGMGSVYQVEHLRLGRHFALKLLRADWARERAMVERFEREARAAAALSSPYVVSLVDSGVLDDGRPYFVMEHLVGQDLAQLLKACGELPIVRAVNLVIDACLGLQVAHTAGLVHRDLKPENLFVTTTPEGRDLCKLLDFGVAKLENSDHTRPGALVGTARYMAPEQVTSDRVVGPRADLFALGVILYRCLSGQHPFEADSLERVLFKIMNEAVPALDTVCPHVPPALAEVVARAMARDPKQRPASALALAHALSAFAGERREVSLQAPWQIELARDEPSSGDRPTPSDFDAPQVREVAVAPAPPRRPWMVLGASAGLCALSVALFVSRRPAPSASAQRPLPAEPRRSVAAQPESALRALPSVVSPPPIASVATASITSETAPAPRAQRPKPLPARAPSASPPPVRWFDPKNPYVR